jgi:MerR family mercuric resistance operon transcriptional regulator
MTKLRCDHLSIGELSRRAGVAVDTIRYYEKLGIIPKPARTGGGHRTYGGEAIRALGLVRTCRSLGFPLADVAAITRSLASGYRCGDIKAIAEGHLETVRRKRAELQAIEDRLVESIGRCGDPDDPSCAFVDSLVAETKQRSG